MLNRDSETSARRGLKMDGCCGYLSSFLTFYLFLNNIRFGLLDLFIVILGANFIPLMWNVILSYKAHKVVATGLANEDDEEDDEEEDPFVLSIKRC
ncbi:hypothetical protein Hanom_Chr02g00097491 [Helianthus anomalus]